MARALPPPERRIDPILKALEQAYPDAACSLAYQTPLELLVATILSAQCTDVLVNKVTPALFRKYRTAADYARADLGELEQDLAKVTFFRMKARNIQRAGQLLVERHGGKVPNRMEALLDLPGVARKTANVVLGNAFGIQAGIVVDTHVMRLSQRIGLSVHTDRNKIELDLMRLVPQPRWTRFGHQMITHGRAICKALAPKCGDCPLGKALCPSYKAPLAHAATAASAARKTAALPLSRRR